MGRLRVLAGFSWAFARFEQDFHGRLRVSRADFMGHLRVYNLKFLVFAALAPVESPILASPYNVKENATKLLS